MNALSMNAPPFHLQLQLQLLHASQSACLHELRQVVWPAALSCEELWQQPVKVSCGDLFKAVEQNAMTGLFKHRPIDSMR